MRQKFAPFPFVIIALLMVLLLSACNLPVAPTGTPTDSNTILTAAAETVSALGTEQSILTPQPGVETATLGGQTETTPPAGTSDSSGASGTPAAGVTPGCDQAGFVQDVNVPDGTIMAPGQEFTKTWRLRNTGNCTWNTNYTLTFVSGDSMGAPASVPLPGEVAPNATVDISVDLKAPPGPGRYTGYWKLKNPAGHVFGVEGDSSFYVEVVVSTTTPTPNTNLLDETPVILSNITATPAAALVYDFVSNACSAEWRSDAGELPCPGSDLDVRGFVMQVANPTLETGIVESGPTLLTHPQQVDRGLITGVYPAQSIQSGYHFRSTIGCLYGASACSVRYQLNYMDSSGGTQNLGQWDQIYNNSVSDLNVDLSSLAGETIQIVLVVLANGSFEEDKAVWVSPRIVQQ